MSTTVPPVLAEMITRDEVAMNDLALEDDKDDEDEGIDVSADNTLMPIDTEATKEPMDVIAEDAYLSVPKADDGIVAAQTPNEQSPADMAVAGAAVAAVPKDEVAMRAPELDDVAVETPGMVKAADAADLAGESDADVGLIDGAAAVGATAGVAGEEEQDVDEGYDEPVDEDDKDDDGVDAIANEAMDESSRLSPKDLDTPYPVEFAEGRDPYLTPAGDTDEAVEYFGDDGTDFVDDGYDDEVEAGDSVQQVISDGDGNVIEDSESLNFVNGKGIS
jgi:hypothetical protein